MDRQKEAKLRYDRLKKALADEKHVRRRAQRARIMGLLILGAWILVPASLFRVDLAEVARPEFFRTPTPHEAHLLDLSHGEIGTEAGKLAWESASILAVQNPLSIGRAYQELGLFTEGPYAIGIRVHVPAGQRLHLDLEPRGAAGDEQSVEINGRDLGPFSGIDGAVFLDLFRAGPNPDVFPVPVESGEWNGRLWSFDAAESGDYVLRIQPAFGEVGHFRLALRIGARWLFPVAGGGEDDIGGVFGDPRDGGRRDHHGLDIFKPRGTPVVAATDGVISSVDTTEIGGRVVWLRESRGRHSLYYAHLDTPLVEDGQRVQAGDTVGLVGNTGNARTTPPHLHFGAYSRGPVDPWDLILPQPPQPRAVNVSLSPLGHPGASLGGMAVLRRAPWSDADVLAEVDAGAPVTIVGATAGWYRVVLSDGTAGFLSGDAALEVPDGTREADRS